MVQSDVHYVTQAGRDVLVQLRTGKGAAEAVKENTHRFMDKLWFIETKLEQYDFALQIKKESSFNKKEEIVC